jgi:hypothetical protein
VTESRSVSDSNLPALVARVEGLMDDVQAWLAASEAQARRSGDRQAAQNWQQRQLRLRAYRQGLITMLNEDANPPA